MRTSYSLRIFVLMILFFVSGMQAKTLIATKIKSPPQIDGWILHDEWTVEDSASGFIQLEPFKDQPATEPTTVYLMFDTKNIYIAFKCYTESPNDIVAHVQSRDQLEKSDDVILIMLDSFADNRSSFAFLVNPLGTQTDLRIADDGKSLDYNWDTVWDVATQVTSWGWSVEVKIPFTSIRYNPKIDKWGVNFGRIIRKNSETVYWTGPMNDDFRVSQGGSLRNIQVPEKEHVVRVTPYATARYDDLQLDKNSSTWSDEIGSDMAYRITPGLSANMTINPDFASVEGDQEQINLTRWELQFPEKRLFFLEGGELFNTRIKTFYSRRIGDIDYGSKLVGKINKYNLALIGVRTVKNEADNMDASNFAVFRLKRDILNSSTFGITAINKSWSGGYSRSFSADYVLNLGKAWKLTGQWVSSAPGKFLKNSAYFMRIARESNIYHYHIRYSDTGQDFSNNVNQTGFIRDDDMREIDSDLIYRWWFQGSGVKYLSLSSRNNIFWNHAGTLRSWNITEMMRVYLNTRWSFDISYNNEYKLYEKKFYNYKSKLELGYNTDEWASAGAGYTRGVNFDRDFWLGQLYLNTKPTDAIAVGYSLRKLDYNPDLNGASTIINILSLDYHFTRDLWCRVLAQNNSRDDRFYFYGLFAWQFRPPFGALYLIYTSDEYQSTVHLFKEKAKILFLKLSYQFQL